MHYAMHDKMLEVKLVCSVPHTHTHTPPSVAVVTGSDQGNMS